MNVQYDSVIFAFDMSVFSSGGQTYVTDFGPYSFHMRFGAGAAAPVPQLDASLLFSGAQFAYYDGDLARFYAALPQGTQPYTWLVSGGSTVVAAGTPRVFSCYNNFGGGVCRGIMLSVDSTASPQRLYAHHLQGAAAFPMVRTAAAEPYMRLYGSSAALTVEVSPRGLINQANSNPAWALAFGAVSYDTAIVPRIGCDPAGAGQFLTGRLKYLALMRGALSSPDLAELSRLMSEGSQKPFCWRAT